MQHLQILWIIGIGLFFGFIGFIFFRARYCPDCGEKLRKSDYWAKVKPYPIPQRWVKFHCSKCNRDYGFWKTRTRKFDKPEQHLP